ncbi:tyrosine-type recombinase/integrase [Enterocloster citroniae]
MKNKVEILQYALENGIIDLSYVQEEVEMNQRREYLAKHPFTIWEGKDGKWRTYLPDKTAGRRLVKRSSKKEIESAVVKFYQASDEKIRPVTFCVMYARWKEVQAKLVSDNSIAKYNTDYRRYFAAAEFSRMEVTKITEEDIKVFLCETIKSQKLCKKAAKTLFGYVRNVMNSAVINHVIAENPMEFLAAKQFYKYCTERVKTVEQRTISYSEMQKLYGQFQKDYEKHPAYIPTYAVEFASLTGMRAGEISALSWSCIMDSYIIVDKSEKFNRITKEYYIDATKNGKARIFPMTNEIRSLLKRVKDIEVEYGYESEWVFSNENGRVHAPVISSCSKNKCRQTGISEKGIYAYRRTVNSKMRCEGVSATVAAALLGHTEDVNDQYYTYDISGIEEKSEIISRINAEMPYLGSRGNQDTAER